jgi:hypothetical protein
MYNVPCANTFYLNQYLKTLDGEADWEDAVEKKMEEVRVCVIRSIYQGIMVYSPVLVESDQNYSPIVFPLHGLGIVYDSSNDFLTVHEALIAGEKMKKPWAEFKLENACDTGD